MKLAIITPVGPGHEDLAKRCIASVQRACEERRGSWFTSVRHVIVEDHDGKMGRSRARNIGMDQSHDADWYFFLDADDTMKRYAIGLNDFYCQATFGAVSLDGEVFRKNVHPCGWHEVATRGACGTLSMGFFVKGRIARALRFNETMDYGEDFDFYMRLPKFTKVEKPLVDIGYSAPSAGGSRGYDRIDWTEICNGIISDYVMKDRRKYDLRDHAVLEKAGGAISKPGAVSQPLSA